MEDKKTIVLVLKSGGDFSFKDVELISKHIHGKWKSEVRPRIILLWDRASEEYDLGNIKIIPMQYPGIIGTWSRMQLFSPLMEQYKPFLYVDLDTAIIESLENIFDLVKDKTQFITLEDFWQRNQLATGLVWYPKDCNKTEKVWNEWKNPTGTRMDNFLRRVLIPDLFWQTLTDTIYDFKPDRNSLLKEIPTGANLICFHGKPRIFDAQNIKWVKDYISQSYILRVLNKYRVTVIIPYKVDRGWLNDAVKSVPKDVELLLSQGKGNWPENFNKALDKANGDCIRWLHEDDMLTPNCIEDSVNAIEKQGVDFIHGNAYELHMSAANINIVNECIPYIPRIQYPTLQDLLMKNKIHSATLMYRREVFEKVGKMNETLNSAEEFEFNLRCLKAGLKIGYCDSFLAYYRKHPQQKVRVVSGLDKKIEREQVRNLYR